jgi:hypothetical protein
MEVHAPHEPIHSWRDFIVHIVIITIGLLIALGLEAAVEAWHHRNERSETRQALHAEIQESRKQLPKNLRALVGERRELEQDIALLRALRAHHAAPAGAELRFDWYWNSMPNSAWETARETGALALFPSDDVQGYDEVYGQQALVNDAGIELTHSLTKASIPLNIEPDLNALSPALVDELIRNCATSLDQIDYVETLAKSLDAQYQETLGRL